MGDALIGILRPFRIPFGDGDKVVFPNDAVNFLPIDQVGAGMGLDEREKNVFRVDVQGGTGIVSPQITDDDRMKPEVCFEPANRFFIRIIRIGSDYNDHIEIRYLNRSPRKAA